MPRPITLALACLLVCATPALADAPVRLAYGGPAAEQDFQKYKQNVETSLQEAEAALKANKPAEAIGQLGFLEHEGQGALRRYEALKAKGVDLTRVTYVIDNQDISGVALLADLERMMAVAANRAHLHQQAQAKWKAVLKGDRLKVYLEHGQPEWKDDVNGFDPASAAKAAWWSYSRGPYHSLQLGRYRIYKEFHFSGDKLVKQTTENKPY